MVGETIVPMEARLRDLDCQRLRATLGAEVFEAEYAAGRALTADQVARLASGAGERNANRCDRP